MLSSGFHLLTGFFLLILTLSGMALADSIGADESRSVIRRDASQALSPTGDVAADARGMLRGWVVATPDAAARFAGVPVEFRQRAIPVVVTTTDARGAFAVQNLRPGLYEITVSAPGETLRRTYRVWSSATAPPSARPAIEFVAQEAVVRGQRPTMVSMSGMEEKMALAVIAAGAVAAPVMYNNARENHRVPLSP